MKTKTNKHDEQQFQEHLGYLNLTSIRENYEPEAKTAAEKHLSHVEYLARLVEGEAALRRDRSIARRIKMARFPVIKALDEFDWCWPKKINRLQVQDLFRLSFIKENANVIMVGGVGLGKTHLSIALGHSACLAGHSVLFASAIDILNTLAAAQSTELEESLKTQYEDELESLRRQLALARQAALERERALQAQAALPETEAAPPSRETTSARSPVAPPPTTAGPTVSSRLAEATISSPSNPTPQIEPPVVARETTEAAPAPTPEPTQPEVELGDLVPPGPGVTPPKLLRGPLPRYPPIAQRMKREADVRVSVLVDENGRVIEAHSIGSKAGMGFEQAAVDAARKTTWKAAEKNGVKVKMRLDLTIKFRI